jgi:hypothetical protein
MHTWRKAPERGVRVWQCTTCLGIVESDKQPAADRTVALWPQGSDESLALFFDMPHGSCDEAIVYRIMES